MRRKRHVAGALGFVVVLFFVSFVIVSLKNILPAAQRDDSFAPTPINTVSETSTIEQSQQPKPTMGMYQNSKFSFNFDPQYKMKESSSSGISWSDPTGTFSMELSWQSDPFPKTPQVVADTKSLRIEKDKEVTISKNKVRELVYGCGNDCYFHELQIQSDDEYYRLKASIAPEGKLEGKFQQVITSLKFTQ